MPNAHVRRAAVSALAFSQTQIATETIIRALTDDDWMVREIAAETLGGNANGRARGRSSDQCPVATRSGR